MADASEAKTEIEALQEQLSLRPSFDEVSALRSQLANIEVVATADVDAASSDVERRSLQRQRELEARLEEVTLQVPDLQKDVEGLRSKLDVAQDEICDLQRLVQRLETELANASATKAPSSPSEPLAALMRQHTPEACADSCVGEAVGCSSGSGGAASMPSMLDIITGQRDRLRERVGTLEQDRDRWRTSAEDERKRAEQLHSDNVKLVERTKYLQSYQPKQGAGGRRPPRGKLDPDLEGRYSANEDSLGPSPFEHFQKEEKAKKIAGMNIGERLLYMLSVINMASKPARIFTLAYLSAIHLLIFLVLWRLAYTANHHKCVIHAH
jgi:homeobox protein cut-like